MYLQIEIKKPYQTFSSEQAELSFLGKYEESVAIEMIKQAMKNGWKNIREIEAKTGSKIDAALSVAQQQEREIKQKYGNT